MKTLSASWLATLLLAGTILHADIPSFFGQHCSSCHGDEEPKAGLNLSTLRDPSTSPDAYRQWVKIHDRIAAGEMPPKSKRQPSDSERTNTLSAMARSLVDHDRHQQRTQGRVPMRRLNRTEYEHTVRDLFALPNLQVRELLPMDGRTDGFEKTSEALEMSPAQIRKYMEVADLILDAAIATHDQPPIATNRFRMIGSSDHFGRTMFPVRNRRVDLDWLREINERPLTTEILVSGTTKADAIALMTQSRIGFTAMVHGMSAPYSGPYRIRTRLFSFRIGAQGEWLPEPRGQFCELTVGDRFLGFLDAPSLQSTNHEVVTWLGPSDSIHLNPTSLWPNYFHVLHPSTPAMAAHIKWGNPSHPFHYRGPVVAVEYVDVEGPLHHQWPPESHRRLFGPLAFGPAQQTRGQKPLRYFRNLPRWTVSSTQLESDLPVVVRSFLDRAFRRPVSPAELEAHLDLARRRLSAGDPLEEALRAVYRTALCSPDFLFLHEPTTVGHKANPNGEGLDVDDLAVASRLSYFLWNSAPDEALLEPAKSGQLHAAELRRQAARMLRDPRSSRFINDFVDQWLGLRDIDFTSPDVALYPEFRSDLRHSMIAETRDFFRCLLDEDLGVRNFIDSDFLCVNERLAEHYDVPGVHGSAFRKVAKPAGSPRGGFLTQGSILKITANGTVTSPVKRGAWVLDRLLGTPPRPPPPNTPAVEPDVRGATTIRRQLELHRSSPSCASCHDSMDPPGFALESFDVIGRWRSHYRFRGLRYGDPEQRRGRDPSLAWFPGIPPSQWADMVPSIRVGAPVDPSGTTPEGTGFQDIRDYKRLLLQHEEVMARAFVQRLVLYATGAPVRFGDRAQVDAILQSARSRQFGVQTLLLELIGSPIFRQK
jgi:Protein of unknown function (DUF1592)/Protein of unknown function (DUF1588)/Protein of unknown function (DUF1587)/Protein of unknown function (DUF1595)/Protein of unknown function (DUF1585)/Planctomycete cytochrome C